MIMEPHTQGLARALTKQPEDLAALPEGYIRVGKHTSGSRFSAYAQYR
jgi:hypothetical protein